YDHGGPSKNLHIDPEYALDQFQTHNLYDIVFLCNFDILNQPDHISEDKSESGPDDRYVQCQDCSLDEHIRIFVGQKNHPFEGICRLSNIKHHAEYLPFYSVIFLCHSDAGCSLIT